jgi:CheY-like chemotaxis protein
MEHDMELTVPHMVRRPASSSPSDAPFGSGKALPEAYPIATKPREPVQTNPFALDPETSSPQPILDPDHKMSADTNMRVEARTARSILVVEDDPDIAMALQDLLEFEGFQVDCAQTCRQAFSSIEENAYHAILLDLGLPDGDGCSILEKLQVSTPSLPVIVLTASNRDLGSLRAYARLTKPWDRGELCEILHRAISTASS